MTCPFRAASRSKARDRNPAARPVVSINHCGSAPSGKGDRKDRSVLGSPNGKSLRRREILKKLTREEMHKQCVREIRGTLIVAVLTCAWECIWAFALNGSGKMFLGMPAWLSVSVFGSIVVCLLGVWYLMKKVFIDFEYDEEVEDK